MPLESSQQGTLPVACFAKRISANAESLRIYQERSAVTMKVAMESDWTSFQPARAINRCSMESDIEGKFRSTRGGSESFSRFQNSAKISFRVLTTREQDNDELVTSRQGLSAAAAVAGYLFRQAFAAHKTCPVSVAPAGSSGHFEIFCVLFG